MYDLFLENGDLLENVEITNEINALEMFDNFITESEMLCSIYEHQRFIIEQDTQVFMNLKYDNSEVITESVFSKIWEGVKAILKKIKDLIMKFINFITGKRKEESKEEPVQKIKQETEKLQKDPEVKKAAEDVKELIKYKVSGKSSQPVLKSNNQEDEDNNKPNYKVKGRSSQPSLKEREISDEKAERLQAIFEKKYTPVILNPIEFEYFKNPDDSKTIQKIFKGIDEGFELLNDDDTINLINDIRRRQDILKVIESKYPVFSYLLLHSSDINPYQLSKETWNINMDNNMRMFIFGDPVDRDEYYDKYFNNSATKLFESYKEKSIKVMQNTKKSLDGKIKPLETKIKAIDDDEKYDNIPASIISTLSRAITNLSQVYTNQIRLVSEIEQAYTVHVKNIKMLFKDNKELKKLSKK